MPFKPFRFIITTLFLFLVAGQFLFAKTWIVSPQTDKNGCRPAGAGTKDNPFDLQTALSGANGLIKPGDTVYLNDGESYKGFMIPENTLKIKQTAFFPRLYESTVSGTKEAPIIFIAFPGAHPVIDCGPNSSPEAFKANHDAGLHYYRAGLEILGSYTWFWGITITNSDPHRECHDPDGYDIHLTEAVNVAGDHNKLINLVIHDNTSTGISAFSGATNTEIEGCLIYYNGMVATRPEDPKAPAGNYKKNGPGIYSQNTIDSIHKSRKIIRNNVIFQQFYNGVQIYGSKNAVTDGYDFSDNTIFNNGLISKTSGEAKDVYGDYNMIFGGHRDMHQNNISGNQICYFTNYYAKGNFKMGYNDYFICNTTRLDSNIFVSSANSLQGEILPVILNNLEESEYRYNIVYSRLPMILDYRMELTGDWHKKINVYLNSDYNYLIYPDFIKKAPNYFNIWRTGSSNKTEIFNYQLIKGGGHSWPDSFRLDQHSRELTLSDFIKNKKNNHQILITQDHYEPGLAKIVILNWDSASEISINPAGVIPAGNSYRLLDIQHFLQGKPQEGSFQGKIGLKMAGLSSDVPYALKENPPMVQPEHTDARFGVYWLEYFPYFVKPILKNGKIIARCYDISGKEIVNPPFLTFLWKKDGKKIAGESGITCLARGDGKYECSITDDHSLTKTVIFKISPGKVSR